LLFVFVVEELILIENKLPFLELVAVETLLVELALPLVGF
jgi:hypothetical protein